MADFFPCIKSHIKQKKKIAKYSVHNRAGSMYRFFRIPYFTLYVSLASLRKRLQHDCTSKKEKKKKKSYRTSQSVRDTLNIKYILQLVGSLNIKPWKWKISQSMYSTSETTATEHHAGVLPSTLSLWALCSPSLPQYPQRRTKQFKHQPIFSKRLSYSTFLFTIHTDRCKGKLASITGIFLLTLSNFWNSSVLWFPLAGSCSDFVLHGPLYCEKWQQKLHCGLLN